MQTNIVRRGQLLFLSSFATLIAIGTLVLKLPAAVERGPALDWSDALFTATSAVCLTGLTVVSQENFSGFGQVVIALLIQLSGIGVMALSASILLAIGRGLSFSNALLISSVNDNFSLRGTEGFIRTVINFTIAVEAVGAVVIYAGLLLSGDRWLVSLWNAMYLAISSFCNAGLGPFDAGLEGKHALVKLGCSGLFVLGGIGVYVVYDVCQVLRRRQLRLRVHSKVVIAATVLLLAAGWLLIRLLGAPGSFRPGWLDAWFLSASSRTAGFTTFNLDVLPPVTLMTVIVLMLIGGSPGSTAGGIKTSTIAVTVAAIWNTIAGNNDVLMFKRAVPTAIVMRGFTIIVLFLLLFFVSSAVIQLLTPGATLLAACFEAASALSTTGLSIQGTTGNLTVPGKLFVSVLMYIGRMGPFTIMLFLLGREKPGQLRYPQERVIIG